jgi:hypothetical protein
MDRSAIESIAGEADVSSNARNNVKCLHEDCRAMWRRYVIASLIASTTSKLHNDRQHERRMQ